MTWYADDMLTDRHRKETRSSARTVSTGRFAGATLALLSVACSSGVATDDASLASASQAILGGEKAEDCQWPAVVSLGVCTGVLVNPRLIVYAAHCGDGIHEVGFGVDALNPDFTVSTERCVTRPNARLGDGTDVAYCVLSEAITGVEPARILAGCELEHLQAGSPAILVGFGANGPEGDYGTLRWGASAIGEVGDELLLDSEGVDTCRWDSGGPLFIEFDDEDEHPVRRVAGITSAGSDRDCGTGVSHYVNLAEQVSWLEESSGIDVTPCFDGEAWAPTPGCVSTVGMKLRQGTRKDGRICGPAGDATLLATCGDSFDEGPGDEDAPELEITSPRQRDIRPLEDDETYLEFDLRADAEDDGWGVAGVTFTLVDANGDPVFKRLDEVPPYEIAPFRVPKGNFTLVVEATDHAGNSTSRDLVVDTGDEPHSKVRVEGRGCQVTPYSRSLPWWIVVLLPLALLRRNCEGRSRHRAGGVASMGRLG